MWWKNGVVYHGGYGVVLWSKGKNIWYHGHFFDEYIGPWERKAIWALACTPPWREQKARIGVAVSRFYTAGWCSH